MQAYGRLLGLLLAHPGFTVAVAAAITMVSLLLALVVGTDFFPSVDAGLMKLHFRAPPGTRLERTEQLVNQLEAQIREVIPPAELVTVNSMIGVPLFYNLAFVPTDNVSAMDADILIALAEHHHPTEDYLRALRRELPGRFPGSTFYIQPADIVSQVLNFGLSAPLDIQIEYPNLQRAFEIARTLRDRVREVPGTADVHIVQMLDYPTLRLDVDRQQAAQLGLSQRDVASSVLISLSASSLIAPSFFLNQQNNVNYTVVVKAPLSRLRSVPDLLAMPLTPPSASALWQAAEPPGATLTALPQAPTQTLDGVAVLSSQVTPDQINHHTVQRVLDIQANLDGRDLGAVARDIGRKIAGLGPLPTGMRIHVRGQNEVMQQSFRSLGLGLVLAIVLVYFLMVVLFQSWLDPFIIMIAVPGALVGILWMLALTGTTINVESLMGAIMAVGIAVSNSILMVSFANDSRLEAELSAAEAALLAGKTRLRPVLMTALAMIIGMIPMALALGEAGEQNAPLGRAVIGGLLVATGVTLFVVPVVYALLRQALPEKQLLEERFLAERQGANVARAHLPARRRAATSEPAGAAAGSQVVADVADKE